ncbi:unnamed protein product [Clonostachys byssicola]|uniref:N-acetyltransferase domain-containing protein n=1 Tax=Clonostachys byssicola TaxID=160290 RepID=A0A9N9Y7Q3_9HYPO|nr:unnamed protein product [Clonostachys byssicola]
MAEIVVETPRLQLKQLTSNAESSVHLDLFHNVWRDKQATQWSLHGPCENKTASQAWMAGVIPSTAADRSDERVCYAVLPRTHSHRPEVTGHGVADDGPESIGILTLLPIEPIEEGLLGSSAASDASRVIGLDLGYLFLPSAWGQGFATESIRAFLEHYLGEKRKSDPQIRIQIQANVHPDNFGSLNVLHKLGFHIYERVVGEEVVFIGGASRNKSVVKLWKVL